MKIHVSLSQDYAYSLHRDNMWLAHTWQPIPEGALVIRDKFKP